MREPMRPLSDEHDRSDDTADDDDDDPWLFQKTLTPLPSSWIAPTTLGYALLTAAVPRAGAREGYPHAFRRAAGRTRFSMSPPVILATAALPDLATRLAA
jgi:hypothetical protein